MMATYELAVQRRRLRGALRRWRQRADLSQQQAADAMGWSLSKLVRLENGTGRPIAADVLALLTYYGAGIDEAKEFADSARSLPGTVLRSEQSLRELFSPAYVNYLEFEQGSRQVLHWHPTLVPGILQTEEYAYEVLKRAFGKDKDEAKKVIDARLERQELLEQPEGPRFHFILDEGILYRPVGPPQVMRRQIDRVLELTERPDSRGRRVRLDILPLSAGITPGIRGPFVILEFEEEESQDVLFMETPRGDFFSRDDRDDVENYRVIFGELERASKPIAAVRARVDQLLETFDGSLGQDDGAGDR